MEFLGLVDWFSDKNLSFKVKGFLNLVFVGAMASSLFRAFYYDYDLLSINDYSGYYRYFVDGHFLIPFSLFYIIWGLTDFFAAVLFNLLTLLIWRKLQSRIEEYVVKKYLEAIPKDKELREQTELFTKVARLDGVYESMKKRTASLNLIDSLRKKQQAMSLKSEKEFILNFRALLAVSIFLGQIPDFGWRLYLVFLMVIVWNFASSVISHRMAEFIKKVVTEVQLKSLDLEVNVASSADLRPQAADSIAK